MPSFPRGSLLVVMLLASAAASITTKKMSFGEHVKKEREGVGLAPKQLSQDEKPEMPHNFQAFTASSTSIMGLWDAISGVDHYLVFVEKEDMEDTTTDVLYIYEGLEACTNYTVGVKSVSSKGDMSEPALADAQTLVGLPPEPQNLHVEDYTHTTVTLAWEEPDTPCDIDHYRVSYKGGGSDLQETQVSEATLVVEDLLPNTTYTFSVYAATSEGEGSTEATVEQTTAPDHGPPEHLVAEGISSSAINVSWSAPYKEPSYYLVRADPCFYGDEITYDLMYLIKDLYPCDRCYITVTSHYDDDNEFTANTDGETDGGAPLPPESCSVKMNETFITVNWERPSTPCVLGEYRVTWTWRKLWGDGEEGSDSMNASGQSHTVSNPLPYHEYTFEIAASIDGVFGSPASCSGTSLESLAGPPVLRSVGSDVGGEAQVTWDSPVEENGEILQYGIFVNDAENPSKTVSGDIRNTSISLEECVSFDISVEALNHAGWGQRSEVKDVLVVGDVLPEELRCLEPEVQVCWDPFSTSCPVSQYNLKWEGDVLWSDSTDSSSTTLGWSDTEICYNISSTPYTKYTFELSVGTKLDETVTCSSTTPMAAPGPPTLEEPQAEDLAINVTWKEPDEKNGVISAYQVKWTDWNGVENVKSTDGNTFSLEIVVPSCGGKVDVTVRAKTEDVKEFGEESSPRSVFLVNSLSDLMCEPTAPGVIALSWEVEDPKCPIHNYNVTWTFLSLWSDDKGSSWKLVDGKDLSALVRSLPPYSSVSVEVHVDNSPEGTSCTNTTLQQASSPPTEVHQISNDTNSVTVEWSLPESVRGELLGWHLSWTTSSDEYLGAHDISEPDDMEFQISELSPSETYVVYVMAVNGAGQGKAAVKEVTTDILCVNSVWNLMCEPTEPGVIALSWEVDDPECPIQEYNVTWTFVSLWSDDRGSNWTSVDGEETSAILTSLPPYANVSIELYFDDPQDNVKCTTTTAEETSSAPTQLQQIAKGVHSVSVEWSFPEMVGGRLVSWYLYWTSAIGHYVGDHVIENPDQRVFEIGNLEPSEVYYVYVMAVNGAGQGEAAMVEASTEYVP